MFATLQGLAVRHRRRASARVPPSLRRVPSVPRAQGARRQRRRRSGADGRADRASDADCRSRCGCCSSCTAAAIIRPVADTIGRLLDETRAHVGFILRPAGEQALANVLHVAELARQYEAGGGISFRGFIDELRAAADATEAAEAPILEEGSDGVRLMTVHKAKGLEFPVVILADMTCHMSRSEASRYLDASSGLCAMKIGGWAPHELHDHEADEVDARSRGRRASRVRGGDARARSAGRPALGDEPWEGGWFSPLNRALYPPMGERRDGDARSEVSGVQVQGFRARAAQQRTGRRRDRVPGRARVPRRRRLSGRLVGSGALSLGAKPTFGVRAIRTDREGRAEARRRRRTQPLRPLAARAARRARARRDAASRACETARTSGRSPVKGRRPRPIAAGVQIVDLRQSRRCRARRRRRLRGARARRARARAVRRRARTHRGSRRGRSARAWLERRRGADGGRRGASVCWRTTS